MGESNVTPQAQQGPVLSVSELSRRIAEHLEPEPDGFVCAEIAWETRVAHGKYTYVPMDMRAPAMTALLMERLLTTNGWEFFLATDNPGHLEIEMTPTEGGWAQGFSGFVFKRSGQQLPSAVMHAYALAFNLASEDELRSLDTSPSPEA